MVVHAKSEVIAAGTQCTLVVLQLVAHHLIFVTWHAQWGWRVCKWDELDSVCRSLPTGFHAIHQCGSIGIPSWLKILKGRLLQWLYRLQPFSLDLVCIISSIVFQGCTRVFSCSVTPLIWKETLTSVDIICAHSDQCVYNYHRLGYFLQVCTINTTADTTVFTAVKLKKKDIW